MLFRCRLTVRPWGRLKRMFCRVCVHCDVHAWCPTNTQCPAEQHSKADCRASSLLFSCLEELMARYLMLLEAILSVYAS